jgi:uncharacterized tellurite resistance protein B-like protein
MSDNLDNDASNREDHTHLADLDCVIADPLKFKRKLRIGEDAYAVLRLKNGLQGLWDAGGVAATGATVAASKVVATTLFASTASGGLLSALGLGAAAATPIGWVLAAAAASGGVYYGVSRVVRRQQATFVDTIPRFINTPIDLLGMQLLDLIGALALRVAKIDGAVAAEERATIQRHFIEEWGYSRDYVIAALDILETTSDQTRVKAVAVALAQFQAASPDCNAEAMQSELLSFLREVMEADGMLDEREELAIDAITDVFQKERAITLAKVGRTVSDLGEKTGSAVSGLRKRFGGQAADKAT